MYQICRLIEALFFIYSSLFLDFFSLILSHQPFSASESATLHWKSRSALKAEKESQF